MVSLPPQKPSRLTCLKPSKDQYCRIAQLPRLLKMWPGELEDYSYPGTLRVTILLRKALRAERCRARSGHWAYSLSRHVGLMEALKAERERLDVLGRALPSHPGGAKSLSRRVAGTLRLPNSEKSADGQISRSRGQTRPLAPATS